MGGVYHQRVLLGEHHQRPGRVPGLDVEIQVKLLVVGVEEVVGNHVGMVTDVGNQYLGVALESVEQHARPVAEGVDVHERDSGDCPRLRDSPVYGMNRAVLRGQREIEVSHSRLAGACQPIKPVLRV
ncbi:hypothetical protein [Natronomonas sp. CBA1123]|uniref:hypothetical protein n=1 Tax=Natronomonas sp. CBA1123 TaxID=2668070 RepID=UPI001E37A64B|nr:hypothetical protein [Natronomonas sp. CBA1123]